MHGEYKVKKKLGKMLNYVSLVLFSDCEFVRAHLSA